MSYIHRIRARGQVTSILALLLGLGVLMGFIALAFDGSSALLQRRNMQNGADASALAAVQFLGSSIVWDEGRYAYLASNQDVMGHIESFLGGNRGGVTGQPNYRAQVEYGTLDTDTGQYSWTVAATYASTGWTFEEGYPADDLVPFTVDAVRVTPGIDNPTTFARIIGVATIPVSARAAAALTAASDEVGLSGPTWPITRCQFPNEQPPLEAGICRPYLFWSARIDDEYCDTNANFKSLLQLGAHQGRNYEGTNLQLITQADPRIGDPLATPVVDATANDSGNNNYENCVGSEFGMNALMNGFWSPQGNCTDPVGRPGMLGRECCSSNASVADSDVNNFVMNNFQGRISLTATSWPDINGGYSDRRSSDHADSEGDWIEVYNGGGLGNNIQMYFARHVQQNGQSGVLTPYYGEYVSKVLFLYDDQDNEIFDYPQGCNPQQEPCEKVWQAARGNDVPQRVHMTQAFVFQFYERLVDTNAEEPILPPSCDPSIYDLPNVASSQVYGLFSGLVLPDPPPDPNPVPHGLYNYVGYIDP